MNIAHIRRMFREGRFSFYFHAFQEALKDGITGDDILYVIERGEIIEDTRRGNAVWYLLSLATMYPFTL